MIVKVFTFLTSLKNDSLLLNPSKSPCHENCPDGCPGCDSPFCSCAIPDQNPDFEVCSEHAWTDLGKCLSTCHGDGDCLTECYRQHGIVEI